MSVLPPIRICHVVSGLGVGGAETSLVRLVEWQVGRGDEVLVVSASRRADLAEPLRALGATVVIAALDAKPWDGWRRARAAVLAFAPSLLQGWMYHGNLLVSALHRGAREAKTIWGIRHSLSPSTAESLSTRLALEAAARLPLRPDCVVYNSEAGRSSHLSRFGRFPSVVISNGIDTRRFRPNAARRAAARETLGVSDDDFVVGYVGRQHRHKDIPTLLAAFGMLQRDLGIEFEAVLLGDRFDEANESLAAAIDHHSVRDGVRLLGRVADMSVWYPAFDLLVLTSSVEGTPNVLLEAMACGVDVVTTDAGDAARVVGDAEKVAAVGDALGVAERIAKSARNPVQRRADGAALRERCNKLYSREAMEAQYDALYRRLLGG